MVDPCPDCNGRGTTGVGYCRTCLGAGRLEAEDPDETHGREMEGEWQALDSST